MRIIDMKLDGRLGLLLLGSGMTVMSTAAGSETKTRMPAKTNVEILAHRFRAISPIPVARPQPPKPKSISESKNAKGPKFVGTLAAGLDFDNKVEASTITTPPNSVKTLPMIATTAEIVIPTERGIGYSSSDYGSLNITRLVRRATHSLAFMHHGRHSRLAGFHV